MFNKVILMGRLTADPECKMTSSNIATCRFSVAVDRPYQKDTERQADFINVVVWRKTAEFVSKYFSKGKMIIVEGSLRNNNYTDKNGTKHYGMDVVADNVSFGGGKSDNDGGNQTTQTTQATQQKATAPIVEPDVPLPPEMADFEEQMLNSKEELPF